MHDEIGFMYKMNRMGPATKPWETLQESGGQDVSRHMNTVWLLSVT